MVDPVLRGIGYRFLIPEPSDLAFVARNYESTEKDDKKGN
jgi:hypothetical protein